MKGEGGQHLPLHPTVLLLQGVATGARRGCCHLPCFQYLLTLCKFNTEALIGYPATQGCVAEQSWWLLLGPRAAFGSCFLAGWLGLHMKTSQQRVTFAKKTSSSVGISDLEGSVRCSLELLALAEQLKAGLKRLVSKREQSKEALGGHSRRRGFLWLFCIIPSPWVPSWGAECGHGEGRLPSHRRWPGCWWSLCCPSSEPWALPRRCSPLRFCPPQLPGGEQEQPSRLCAAEQSPAGAAGGGAGAALPGCSPAGGSPAGGQPCWGAALPHPSCPAHVLGAVYKFTAT